MNIETKGGEPADDGIHVCPRHDFDIVDDPKAGCPDCNAERVALQSKACASVGVSPAQEPKYTVNGHAIVNRASGEEIPADEPVFIFRARDALGVRALYAYLEMIGEREPESLHSEAVRARIAHFQEFARKFPERMKWPDTAALASPAHSVGEPWYGHEYCEHPGGVWKCRKGCGPVLYATPPAAPAVTEGASNWHRHHVAVEKAALQMVRNALRTDAETGRSVRAEMLEILDNATSELAAPAAAVPESPAAQTSTGSGKS